MAVMITSVTAWGWEIMITWEPSTSTIVASARSAQKRTTSVPRVLSPVATTAHVGSDFQAGAVVGSANVTSEIGRWVAAIRAVWLWGRSAANTSWTLAGSITNSVAVSVPLPVGYLNGTRAVNTTLSREPSSRASRVSPSSGAKPAT